MTDIEGKVVLVTGAASGIGRACAEAFAAERAGVVVVCDIDSIGLQETLYGIAASGFKAVSLEMDVTDAASVEAVVSEVVERFGSIDLVVNSAGVGVLGPFEALTPDDWRKVVDVNLWGTVNVDRAVYARMLDRGSGHIVNVSSANGIYAPMPYLTPYVTSKFAVAGLSEALLVEGWEHGIKVTCLCPGNVKTPIYEKSPFKGFSEGVRALTRVNVLVAEKPEKTAAQLVKAVKRDRFLVVTTPVARLSAFARTHLRWAWFAYTRVFAHFCVRLAGRYRAS